MISHCVFDSFVNRHLSLSICRELKIDRLGKYNQSIVFPEIDIACFENRQEKLIFLFSGAGWHMRF